MERLGNKKAKGINGNALRTWGLLFMAAGVIGEGLLQTRYLGIGRVSGQQLLEIMGASDEAMTVATLAIVLQAVQTCAAPIFALLLVNGMQHTKDFKAYMLRVATLAVLCEIPYNLAMSNQLFAADSRNPVFGLVLCMVMVWFFRYYSAPGVKNKAIKVFVTAAAIVWCRMLKIDTGESMVLLVAVLWAYRAKPMYRNFAGAAAAIVCTLFDPFFLAAPMGFMAVHAYNEEPDTNDRRVNYLAYPALLVAVTVIGFVL